MYKIKTVGSVCSGIEAASVAWEQIGFEFKWFSEIESFPSLVLQTRHSETPNLGDMNTIPKLLNEKKIYAPDLICGGTPCQAFSVAGRLDGLNDDRGNLTLRFIDIIEENDKVRVEQGKQPTVVFWENVEGVLTDKTNAFGCFVSTLAGLTEPIEFKKWASSGIIKGPKRNVAWRVLDAKYFGLPQQRKRLYVIATGKELHPENVLFEKHNLKNTLFSEENIYLDELKFTKEGVEFEVFREYTDCLYSAYGTKWNGNAAAYNGSLFVVQDKRIRRLSPLECERLMGFPDNYTAINNTKKTNRYQAIGNSWAIPVVKWIGERFHLLNEQCMDLENISPTLEFNEERKNYKYYSFGKSIIPISKEITLNCSDKPENIVTGRMIDIVSSDAQEDIYMTPTGCYGIVRRKNERNLKINPRLEQILLDISSQASLEEIEKRSRVQKRGKFSKNTQQLLNI